MSTRSQLTKDLNESVKTLLGRHTKILVKYMVKLEVKSDKTENRVLVFTPVRVYLLTAKVPTRIDCHFHYLDIQSIESRKPTHFTITTNDKSYSFSTIGDAGSFTSNADVILTDLSSAIKQIFPTVPLRYIIRKIDVNPIERTSIFSDELRPSDPRNVGPCGGFSMQYACMCDLHAVQYREEVAWDIDTIYLSHDARVLNLRDFDHLEQKDLMAIVAALEYNTFFRGLKASHTRLSTETLERVLQVLRRSLWLEELHLESLGLKSDFIHKLAVAVISNSAPALRSIDLSHNVIEDKGATHLAGPIAKMSKSFSKLALAHCGLTAKGVNQLAHSLSLNQNISNSLTYLDLSGNILKDDVNNLYNFLAQPNVIEHLDISRTDTTLESVFGALLRGCATHLLHLNVSHNNFGTKKGKEIPPSFKQFFTSSLSLKHLNIACCKLPLEALKHLLLGLACNESTAGLYLDLSGNSLGSQGAHVLESCIHGVRVLASLDISDNNMDYELAHVLTAIGKNPSIRSLYMSKCFTGMKLKHIGTVMDSLVNLIQKEDFQLQELVLAENRLKTDLHNFINALGSNQHLQMLDITGNLMGDIGARLLAKALQINNKLKTIALDRNNITLQGYADIVYALENNFSVRNMPFPLHDIAPCLKQHPERTDGLMRKMQELLFRNGNGFKRTHGQGFRLQHGFLLSSTHQVLDKLVAETQETMSSRQSSLDGSLSRLLEDAENCKQLLPKLQESVRCDPHPIEVRLGKMKTELHQSIKSYLEETMETMLRTGIEQCPKTLGSQVVLTELRKGCAERLTISEEFLQSCLVNSAGGEVMNRISEVEQSLASLISDRATDEVLEALTRYRKGLGIAEGPLSYTDDLHSLDGSKHNSSQSTEPIANFELRGLDLPKLGLDSPTVSVSRNVQIVVNCTSLFHLLYQTFKFIPTFFHRFHPILLYHIALSHTQNTHTNIRQKLEYLNLATPQLQHKRRSIARKVRPQSVVGLGIENLSLANIPDVTESSIASVSRSSSNTSGSKKYESPNAKEDECCDSITELPSQSLTLQHLVKGRPKRAKTRAPKKPVIMDSSVGAGGGGGGGTAVNEGIESFFRPGSATPSTLTPLVSPTSEECSSLSFVDSPTLSRDDGGRFSNVTSGETTPILEERKPLKLDRSSPLLKGVNWTSRSRSSDNLEKVSPSVNRKSPLVKAATEVVETPVRDSRPLDNGAPPITGSKSPSNESVRSHHVEPPVHGMSRLGNGTGQKTPIISPKPRPWSVLGHESKNEFNEPSVDSIDTDGDLVLISGQTPGGSIVGITPGAISTAGTGGSILGITPGAVIEKKSVRDMAAGLNKLGVELERNSLMRSSISTHSASAVMRTSPSSLLGRNSQKVSSIISSSSTSSSPHSSPNSSFNTNRDTALPSSSTEESVAPSTDVPPKDETQIKRIVAGKKITALFEETLVEGLQKSSRKTMYRESTVYKDEDTVDV
ncbi:F-actin-uncapping protein LRRC16A isoform X2 [Anopheles funestus]|uniref:F-actin-uncapping protein LRRC16A isoform X2 n=1 Tax=Anopheles funestus TaxID=62324 RepID=UPI0020C70901|nr:F-actin-uncapping protein LRRC16A isoform X2 [Anopheles funestus]